MLRAGDLAWMRTEQNRLLPGTAILQRAGTASDGMGGIVQTWAAIGTVNARVYPVATRNFDESLAGDQITSFNRWDVTLPYGTNVVASDRVVVGNRIYEIVRVNNDEDWKTAVRVECITHNEETI